MPVRILSVLLLLCCLAPPAVAQMLHGEVLDMDGKRPIAGVEIENVYTSLKVSTDEKGGFLIAATGGQLLEFKKQGYKTTNVRIPNGYMPSYFRIIIQRGIAELKEIDLAGNRFDPKADSVRYHDLYKHELETPKLSTFEAIASPFSALSGKNKEVWRFQDDYADFQQQKYVDKTFNEELVTKFTGLKGDSLRYYMRRYRPTYEQVRGMSDYAFFNYIKATANQYRKPQVYIGGQ